MKTMPIASLILDPSAQARERLSQDIVADYAEAMREGATFPPVTAFGTEVALASHGPPRRGRTPRRPRTRRESGRALAGAPRTGRGRACDAAGRVGAPCAAR